MDWSPPGSSVHGILQAVVLEWVAIPFSRGSHWPMARTQVSWIAGRCFTVWVTREDFIGYKFYQLCWIVTLTLLHLFLAITLKHVLNNFIASKRIIIPTMTKTIICKAKQEKKIRRPCSHFILLGNCVCVCVCLLFQGCWYKCNK